MIQPAHHLNITSRRILSTPCVTKKRQSRYLRKGSFNNTFFKRAKMNMFKKVPKTSVYIRAMIIAHMYSE